MPSFITMGKSYGIDALKTSKLYEYASTQCHDGKENIFNSNAVFQREVILYFTNFVSACAFQRNNTVINVAIIC